MPFCFAVSINHASPVHLVCTGFFNDSFCVVLAVPEQAANDTLSQRCIDKREEQIKRS